MLMPFIKPYMRKETMNITARTPIKLKRKEVKLLYCISGWG